MRKILLFIILAISLFCFYVTQIKAVSIVGQLGDETELYDIANAASDPNSNEADATTGWTQVGLDQGSNVFASQGGVKSAGSYALEFNANDTPTVDSRAFQNIRDSYGLSVGQRYTLSFDWRHVGSGDKWSVKLGDTNTASGLTDIDFWWVTTDYMTSDITTFQTVVYSFTYQAGMIYLVFKENWNANNGGVYVDNISIKRSGGQGSSIDYNASGPSMIAP